MIVAEVLTRVVQQARATKLTQLLDSPAGDWAYKRLENAHDSIIELKIEERNGEIRNLRGINSMPDPEFDSKWHELVADEELQLSLRR